MDNQIPANMPAGLAQRDYQLPSETVGPSIDTLCTGLADRRDTAARLNLDKESRMARIEAGLSAQMALIDARREDVKARRAAEIARHNEIMDEFRNAESAIAVKESEAAFAAERGRQEVLDWHKREMAANDGLARGMALALEAVRAIQ